jgi:succinoglycan biosynthesis transport protein ExoP
MSSAPQNAADQNAFDIAAWLQILRTHRLRWMIPTVAITLLAATYALVRQPSWQAAQALVVRSEAGVASEAPGKFRQAEDMKVSQETVLEIARSRSVLAAALQDVGPPANLADASEFPTAKNVEGFRKAVSMTAPKGAEFGTTEIFYLNVKDRDPQRAVALNQAISHNLQTQFQDLLDQKAKSMTVELQRAARLNQKQLDASTAKLSTLESSVGPDLADLRSISKLSAGGSSLQLALSKLEDDLRAAETAERSSEELATMLRAAEHDRRQLLAMPNSLLEKVPALRRLKEGFVDAQLRTAQLLGSMSKAHPSVQGAMANEQEVDAHIRRELPMAIRSIEVDRRLANIKINSIRQQLDDVRQRSQRLATVRAEHAQLVAAVERHTQQVKLSESRLAEARSSEAGARAANLISIVDSPDTGTRPLGPGKTVICGVGLIGGLMTGLGILLLTVPTSLTQSVPAVAPQTPNSKTKTNIRQPSPACAPAASTNLPPCRSNLSITAALAKVATSPDSQA